MKNKIIEEWNNSASTYANLRLKGLDPYEELVNFPSIVKLLGNVKNKKLLDAGCGTGEFSYLLAKKGAKVTGIDGAEKLIDISKKNFPGVTFQVQNLSKKLKFKDKEFDKILCKYVLMLVDDPTPVLKEFKRILKDNGNLVISIPHPTYWFHYWLSGHWGLAAREGFSEMEGYFRIKKFSFKIKGDKNLKFTFIHRPLEYYINLFIRSGFVITEVDEPQSGEKFMKIKKDNKTSLIPKAINFSLTKK